MKIYLTFALAEIGAVGTYFALTIFVTNIIWFIGPKHFPSERIYILATLYAGVPSAFLCGFVGGLLVRSRPVVFGTVFVLVAQLLMILGTSSLMTRFHFWMAALLSVAAASGGAYFGMSIMSRLGKREPLHPVWTGLVALALIVVTWTATVFETRAMAFSILKAIAQ